jgi:hypothetical protein
VYDENLFLTTGNPPVNAGNLPVNVDNIHGNPPRNLKEGPDSEAAEAAAAPPLPEAAVQADATPTYQSF